MKSSSSVSPVRPLQHGSFVDAFGGRYYRIAYSDRLPTFLMNVVGSSDLWMFLASNGGLTAGRVNAGHALFPYQTVDRIYDSAGVIGPFTVLRVMREAGPVLWEPFAAHTARVHAVDRHLYKSTEGDRVWFEEINAPLGLAFRYGWAMAEEHGFVRQCVLENLSDQPVAVQVLDGLRHLLPPGIPGRLLSDSSCLTDAYKMAELIPGTSLAVYSLAAGIVDRAIPMESLRASAVWSEGLPGAEILLSEAQLPAFVAGEKIAGETHRRGIRGVYALTASTTLAPRAAQRWMMVADTDLTQAEVVRRRGLLAGDVADAVQRGIAASTLRLRALVGAADGLQTGGDETTTAHHYANVLFNIMRGGVFVAGHELPGADFAAFVRVRNRPAAAAHEQFLRELPEAQPREAFMEAVRARGDADLERLALEYLPLTFSRRHGDPSRPWNRFNIRVRDEAGRRVLNHEGNWRDIFQNWEALCLSFPEFFESVVAKFVNASTADGYNPYRLAHAGLDWEVPNPDDPWSSIGYWGDHQTVYLLKLLEWSGRFHPGLLQPWLRRDLFTYAAVPYRIANYEAMRRNPHATIEFDAARHADTMARLAVLGTDARLVHDRDEHIVHVNLTEKLLLLALTRLTNFVPGGGIWMNTQRPEWNDANNALVGYGVSMVTLCYLRRFLAHFQQQLLPALGSEPVAVSAPLAQLLQDVLGALETHGRLLDRPGISDRDRRCLLDALAAAGSNYRAVIYASAAHPVRAQITPEQIGALLGSALAFMDHTIRANSRPDGLYHAYNLLEFTDAPAGLAIHSLAPMLEGQVAVLSAGTLSADEAVSLLRALRRSDLYRADQHSYLLYPDRIIPGFVARNVIPAADVQSCPLLRELLDAGDTGLVLQDASGACRFHSDLINGDALNVRLQAYAADPRWAAATTAHADRVRAVYEGVFHHRAFTGRSGSMFGYEGLGCIYWHMVAKLLLAVQENLLRACAARDERAAELADLYHDVRAGLGFNKTPAEYGAFPTDPYSHTPGHSGAQQPGMTGQVKEEILTRLGELGVLIDHGTIRFEPRLLQRAEFTTAPTRFECFDAAGSPVSHAVPAHALAFTLCGVPVVYRLSRGAARIRIHRPDGTGQEIAGTELGRELSTELCSRAGRIASVEVGLGGAFHPYGE